MYSILLMVCLFARCLSDHVPLQFFFVVLCGRAHRSRNHVDTGEAPTGGRDSGRGVTGAAGGARQAACGGWLRGGRSSVGAAARL